LARLTVNPSSQGYRRTSHPSADKKIPKRTIQYPTRQPGGQSTTFNSNNPTAVTGGTADDFQNDNFVSQNNNLSTKVDDFQISNKNSPENFVNDTKAGYMNSLDDFATGDDTDSVAPTVKNSGMVSCITV
jgi:hypothetical protein